MQSPPNNSSLGIIDPDSITESIQNCHVSMEESRRRLMPLVVLLDNDDDSAVKYTDRDIVQEFISCIEQTVGSVDKLLVCLADCGMISLDNVCNINFSNENNESEFYLLMASDCMSKACKFITTHYMKLVDSDSFESTYGGPLDDHPGSTGVDIKIQACMARLAELTLRLLHMQTFLRNTNRMQSDNRQEEDEIITQWDVIEAYAEYQRRCLRSRSKPSITSLAELRQVASSQNCYVSDIVEQERLRQQLESGLHINDEHDDEDALEAADGAGGNVSRGQPHAQSITVILGEASSLIQPLAAWRDALPSQLVENESNNSLESWLRKLCDDAMNILDNEAQTLAVAVGSWFGPDQLALTTLEQLSDVPSSEKLDLVSMEAALEEMAFMCQVMSRYLSFSQQTVVGDKACSDGSRNVEPKLYNSLTELSLHYSTLETRLATLQFNQAFSLASPQLIELGRPALKVPSIVEDAHFVCIKAIERAIGTRSERAIWTVGHWICQVWGLDQSGTKSIYRALMDGVGCRGGNSEVFDDKTGTNIDPLSSSPSKVESTFAASLLEAVDDDIGTDVRELSTSSPPISGGILWGKSSSEQILQNKVDAELCALNGMHSAANACSALSDLFADLVEESLQGDEIRCDVASSKPSMLTFARDELSLHSHSYLNLLQQRVRTLVFDVCGADDLFDSDGYLCLQKLRMYIEQEVYNLDLTSFKTAESDDRLESEMIGPIRRSQIFNEVGKDKCDVAVVLLIAEAMSWKSAEIVLQVLLNGHKEFNEWGAMLLSKQVRALQNICCSLVLGSSVSSKQDEIKAIGTATINTSKILRQFERVNQAVSLLQLEKPSDWLAFAYEVGDSDDTNLTPDEIKIVMSLRLDFSEEAIAKVCSQISSK